jgi:hypothetical protein
MGTLTHETAVSRAREIADRVLAPAAAQNDKNPILRFIGMYEILLLRSD